MPGTIFFNFVVIHPSFLKLLMYAAGSSGTNVILDQRSAASYITMVSERILFTWVHLSDIHAGHGDSSHRWDQSLVLDRLRDDIRTHSDKGIPRPDAIFVSGDLAFSGNVRIVSPSTTSQEYAFVDEWLAGVAVSVSLKRENVFLVPGNHDVQRDVTSTDRSVRRLITGLRDGSENLDEALDHSEDTRMLVSRFSNYLQIASRYAPYCFNLETAQPQLFWSHLIALPNGLTINLIGLNTAILSGDNEDRGKLRVGKAQLAPLRGESLNELVIVMGHHPFDWLVDGDDLHRWTSAHAHIHLCGHVHSAEFERRKRGGGSDLVTVVSGTAHGEANEPIGHGYSFGSIVASPDGRTSLRLWPRKWSDRNKDFRVDVDNVPDGRTSADHDLRLVIARERLSEPAERSRLSDAPITIPVTAVDSEGPVRITLTDIDTLMCDAPPVAPAWVGRADELDLLANPGIKVAVINGIGGQGKSALAARYLEAYGNGYEFWDWRDCREAGDTLQTHILRLIERLSNRGITSQELAGEDFSSIVQVLFKLIAERKVVCVFDNIDHYVDIDAAQPISNMKTLFEAALSRRHSVRFIFTCRPAIIYDDVSFCRIALPGLSLDETTRLFELCDVKAHDRKTRESIADAHLLTYGHPLWLNLIATQVGRKRTAIEDLLSHIRRGDPESLPTTMLTSIWKTLNDNQKTVLCSMAEVDRPLPEDTLSQVSDLNWNRFKKSIRLLKSLNLVVVKSASGAKDTLELHPLVREFVRATHTRNDRSKSVMRIFKVLDAIIQKYKGKGNLNKAPFDVLEHLTMKVEVAINATRFRDALEALSEVADPLRSSGHSEEFVRVASLFFQAADWADVELREGVLFDDTLLDFVTVLSELGRIDNADNIMRRYEDSLVGRGAKYVALCSMRCESYWERKDYESAKIWGLRGVEFKQRTGVDTHFDCQFHLALAQRDSGEIEPALQYFLKGNSLDDILKENVRPSNFRGPDYGNIGRCLWFRGDIEGALTCYRESTRLLDEDVNPSAPINRGWARLWIAYALEKRGDFRLAYLFFRAAVAKWKTISPPKADDAATHAQRILGLLGASTDLTNIGDNQVEESCQRWIHG